MTAFETETPQEAAPVDGGEAFGALDPLAPEFGENLLGTLQQRDEYLIDQFAQRVAPHIGQAQAAEQEAAQAAGLEAANEQIDSILSEGGIGEEHRELALQQALEIFEAAAPNVDPAEHHELAQIALRHATEQVGAEAQVANGMTQATSLVERWAYEQGYRLDPAAVYMAAQAHLPDMAAKYDGPEAAVRALYAASRAAMNGGEVPADTVAEATSRFTAIGSAMRSVTGQPEPDTSPSVFNGLSPDVQAAVDRAMGRS